MIKNQVGFMKIITIIMIVFLCGCSYVHTNYDLNTVEGDSHNIYYTINKRKCSLVDKEKLIEIGRKFNLNPVGYRANADYIISVTECESNDYWPYGWPVILVGASLGLIPTGAPLDSSVKVTLRYSDSAGGDIIDEYSAGTKVTNIVSTLPPLIGLYLIPSISPAHIALDQIIEKNIYDVFYKMNAEYAFD